VNGGKWFALYKDGSIIEENPNLPRKGLLNVDIPRIKEFGIKSDKWTAYFTTIDRVFYLNGIVLGIENKPLNNYKIICRNKSVIDTHMDGNIVRKEFIQFGYESDDDMSILSICLNTEGYCLLRKFKIDGRWIYTANNKNINKEVFDSLNF